MLFIDKKKIVGNEYPEVPMTLEQVIKSNPNTSIPRLSAANPPHLLKIEDVMESLGYEIVPSEPFMNRREAIGDSLKGKKLVLTSATKKDGEWTRNYKKEAIPADDLERFQFELRKKRNIALRYSDFSQIPDIPMSEEKKKEWTAYRQELRDLPEKYDHPIWCNFPKLPDPIPHQLGENGLPESGI